MKAYLLIDFGSTFTKVTAIDVCEKKIIGVSKSFTTIETDIAIGLNNALSNLFNETGNITFEKKFASSSAAGGLKMISIGLVPDLTAKASRLAATSAGAKVVKTYSYEITKKDAEEIEDINPDIVLLSGGIDGGNKEIIIKNAMTLDSINKKFSIIVAGNKSASDDIDEILNKSSRHRYIICDNVMPEFGKLNILPTKNSIRDLFIENIIKAKGLSKAQDLLDSEIIPTPLAVFEAAELLSHGSKNESGIGDLIIFDVGGATTDVYSMADGAPSNPEVYLQGMIEPFAKRTVEGDIGMRYSLSSLVSEAGIEKISLNCGITIDKITNIVDNYKKSPGDVPSYDSVEKKADEEFAKMAVQISAKRHCGFLEIAYSPVGEIKVQTGKDLTRVKKVIGTGGAVINSLDTKAILKKSSYSPNDILSLKPLNPDYMVDSKNILAAMGLLQRFDPDLALKIMKDEIINL